jgi:predicted signal transduction protein with EAL and GGDEF domain
VSSGAGSRRGVVAYVAAVCALGALAAAGVVRLPVGTAFTGAPTFWLFAALVVAGQLRPRRGGDGRQEYGFSVPFGVALLLLHGPAAALLVEVAAQLVGELHQRKPLVKLVFNVGLTALVVGLGGLLLSAAGHGGGLPETIGPSYLLTVLAIGVGYLQVMFLAVSVAIGISTGAPLQRWIDRRGLLANVVSSTVLVALAPGVALVGAAGAWAMWLTTLPVVMAEIIAVELQRRRHAATHDALTGLPNAAGFADALGARIREGGSSTVVHIGLDDFADVAQSLGRANADRLVQGLARRVAELGEDGALVGRGGDEVLLLALPGDVADVRAVLDERLLSPVQLDGFAVTVESTLGIARGPVHEDPVLLVDRAGAAAHAARRAGQPIGDWRPGVEDERRDGLALLAELRHAIDEDQLVLAYQPKIDLATGALVGVEALLRWAHPERGLLMPDVFIPLAERTALIDPLTHHVLDRAIAQAASWHRDGRDLHVAVNISARNLHDRDLPDLVAALLATHGLPAGALELELTERSLVEELAGAGAVLARLRDLGVRIALDDVGTGYSSLTHLRTLPVDVLKIDRSFVLALDAGAPDLPLVQALVTLGSGIGLQVVAEGVETTAARDVLAALGCDLAQGYLYSRPVPAAALVAWADARHPSVRPRAWDAPPAGALRTA